MGRFYHPALLSIEALPYLLCSYEPSVEFPEFTFGITAPSKPGRCAFLGPFIRTNVTNYDSPGNSDAKNTPKKSLPQYFDNTVVLMEWRREYLLELKLDDDGNLLKINPLWNSWEWRGPIDMKIGPDGAAYIVEYGTDFEGLVRPAQISKIQYSRDRKLPLCSFTLSPSTGQPPLTVSFNITTAPGNCTLAPHFRLFVANRLERGRFVCLGL